MLSTCVCCVQVIARAEHLGSGLLEQGCKPGVDQFIGVFAQNRPEVRVPQGEKIGSLSVREIPHIGDLVRCLYVHESNENCTQLRYRS